MERSTVGNRALLGAFVLVVAIALGLVLAGCGGSTSASSSSGGSSAADDGKTIIVAASPTPHAVILTDAVAPILEKSGYTLVVKEYNDYTQPNIVTEEGEVDANYFQHDPYLQTFNKDNGTHLVSVAAVHYEPFGLYAGRSTSLPDLPSGAVVAIPDDTTNAARALLLLEQEGLVKLADGVGVSATVEDIVDNPKGLVIKPMKAETIPNVLAEVDIAAINSNYALGAGLSVGKDALAIENADGPAAQTYKNVIAVKEGNENSEKVKALVAAVEDPAVAAFIDATFDEAAKPV